MNSPIRSARNLICRKDSSPDIYNTELPDIARFLQTCKRRVDFPIPGSPPTNTKDPGTMPPPSTLSSSPIFVSFLSSSESLMSFNTTGSALRKPFCRPLPVEDTFFVETVSSTNVFHALHPGHCPIHFEDSYPHS